MVDSTISPWWTAQRVQLKPRRRVIDTNRNATALVITDPQNDFLSPSGVTRGLVGESVQENRTVEHIEALLKAAKQSGCEVFVSPHYYYPTDCGGSASGH